MKQTKKKTATRTKSRIRFEIVKSVPVQDLIALYKAGGWWEEGAGVRKRISKAVEDSFAFAVAKNEKGKIIGMGRALSEGLDAYIQTVAVLPEWRKMGVGSGIVKTLINECTRRKVGWIAIVAEPGTYPFYHKIGFRPQEGFQMMLFQQGKAA